MIHPLPTEEALHLARLSQREHVRQAERDHLAQAHVRRSLSRFFANLVEAPARVAAVTLLLIELFIVAAR